MVSDKRQAPAALPPKKDSVPIVDGHQGRSGRVRKISPPPGFEPRTVQPVASRYIDWATQAYQILLYVIYVTYFFPKIFAVFEIIFKNVVEPYRPWITMYLLCKRDVCQIAKAWMQTHTQNM